MNRQDVKDLVWLRRKLMDASRLKTHSVDFRLGVGYARAISFLMWDEKGRSLKVRAVRRIDGTGGKRG